MDSEAISMALAQGKKNAEYLLIHVVETAGALLFDNETSDHETTHDRIKLKEYKAELSSLDYKVEIVLGFGNPKNCIPQLANDFEADLLVMGAHGHKGLKDFIFGTTLDAVRHAVKMPVLIVTK